MSLALKINPIEIPELLHIIGCHLSIGDQKTCMLVSKIWFYLFRAYYWNHLYFNRNGVPNLDKYGHLVRSLTTFWADDHDLLAIAGSCHLVQRLELELGNAATEKGLERFTGNLPHIRDLIFRVPFTFEMKHLVAITRLKRIQTLQLGGGDGPLGTECDFMALLNALQECPLLASLRLNGIREAKHSSIAPEWHLPTKRPSEPPSTSTLSRWVRRLSIRNSKANPNTPSVVLKVKEPWRKFVCDTTIQIPAKIPEILQGHLPDATMIYPNLTRLHVKRFDTRCSTAPVGLMFRKAPHLKELHMDFASLTRAHTSECLVAITESCFQLQTLTIWGLDSDLETRSSIEQFFQQHRPDLRHFKLKWCMGLDYALELMPTVTVAALERVCFESSIRSHPALHRFMTRCSSLQYLTWTAEYTRPPLAPRDRTSLFLEPWACYETMRHVYQNRCIDDPESFEAFFGRLALMKRLVSFGISLDDIRRLIADHSASSASMERHGARYDLEHQDQHQPQDQPQDASEMAIQLSTQRPDYDVRHRARRDEDDIDEFLQNWNSFQSVQELTFSANYVSTAMRMMLSKQLDANEIRIIMKVFPRLRKIRYQGCVFPLDRNARELLEMQVERRISIVHTSQLPSLAL